MKNSNNPVDYYYFLCYGRSNTFNNIVKLVESEHPHQNFRASKFQTSKLPAEFINFSQNQGVEQLSDEFKRMLDSETR
ncbi:hypothetical protein H4Q26_007439 [Puccinia striiformis f. sp. tritici PST-130]|nr:hypothetical protein H4Q26_007439 [Puccinia striiformis f. sp. tritici PST-130]